MAYYLAGKISLCETTQGPEKAALEQECFDVILKLWKHRECYQHRKPMQSFAPIFALIRQLHEPELHRYFREPNTPEDGEAESWVTLASHVDYSARLIVRWCLAMASAEAEETEESWLSSPVPKAMDDADDIEAAEMLLSDEALFLRSADTASDSLKSELSDIRKRLDGFVKFSEHLLGNIDAALNDKNFS